MWNSKSIKMDINSGINVICESNSNEAILETMSAIVFILFAVVFVAYQTEVTADNNEPRCSVNETWSLCARACEATCAQPIECLPNCIEGSPGGCRCQGGYVRDHNKCILPKDCSR